LLRIYPPYVLIILICFLAAILFFRPSGSGQHPEELAAYASSSVMLQNWLTGGRQISLNPSLWSVAAWERIGGLTWPVQVHRLETKYKK